MPKATGSVPTEQQSVNREKVILFPQKRVSRRDARKLFRKMKMIVAAIDSPTGEGSPQ